MPPSELDRPIEQRYWMEEADGGKGCPSCGHGQLWDIVYRDATGELCGTGTSYGDAEAAQDICDLMNMAYDFGVESSGAGDSPCGCKADSWGKVQCEERSGPAHTYCKWERQQETSPSRAGNVTT